MTKNEFINRIKRRIDRNRALPITLSNDEIEDIIVDAKNWMYDNYDDSTYEFVALIPRNVFLTQHFRQNRWIQFEDCVYSVYEIFENVGNFETFRYGTSGFIQETIINVMYYTKTYDIITYVANLAYESVLTNLSDKYTAFDWNKNARKLNILGSDPKTDMIIRGYKKIEDSALFEDDIFRRYVEGQARVAVGEILTMYDFTLPGGVPIAGDNYISRGETMIEEVKEEVKEIGSPNWFMEF